MCKMTMIIRWCLGLCAGHCRLSRRITAGCWRPWRCERSLRPPWGCTAGAQHAQTKIKCPYRPSTTKNGWDSSHRTEISLSWKFCYSSKRLTFFSSFDQVVFMVSNGRLFILYFILFLFHFMKSTKSEMVVCLPVWRNLYTVFVKCVLLWIFSLP